MRSSGESLPLLGHDEEPTVRHGIAERSPEDDPYGRVTFGEPSPRLVPKLALPRAAHSRIAIANDANRARWVDA